MTTMSPLVRLKMFSESTQATSKTSEKKEICGGFEDLTDLLAKIYHPLLTTGVTRSHILKYRRSHESNLVRQFSDKEIIDVFDRLLERKLTGNAALDTICDILAARGPENEECLIRLFDHDMKNGMGAKLINSVWPGLVPTFSVALAYAFDKGSKCFDPEKDDWLISRKFDGVRCVTFFSEDSECDEPVKAYSRVGHRFTSLKDMETRLAHMKLPIGFDGSPLVLDGELCTIDASGKEDFRGAVSQVRRKGKMYDYVYYIFDALTEKEFFAGTSERTLSERVNERNPMLKQLLEAGDDHFRLVSQIPYSAHALSELEKKKKENGWEGFILRKDVGYKGRRSNEILKIKSFHTAEYVVETVHTGEMVLHDPETGRPRTETTLTSVDIRHKGRIVSVGSGFSVEQRREFYLHQDKIIGKVIEVQYFEETQSKNGTTSLRFPTLKHFWGDGREC